MKVKFPMNNQDVVQNLQNYPACLIGENPGKLEGFKWCMTKQGCIGTKLLVVPKQHCLLPSKLNLVELHEISAT